MEVHMATLPGVAASVAFEMSKIPLSAAAAAVKGLYTTAKGIDDFFDTLIDSMKRSPSPAIERSGRVFEAAKLGFGFGYLSSATVVAAGQWLMGNHLAAGGVFVTSVTFSNPTVMTCAAMGAVVYGYWALTDSEREELISGLSEGFSVGKEFIKAILHFVIDFTKTLLNSDFIRHLKSWIRETAANFGNGLGYVTRRFSDRIADSAFAVRSFSRKLFNGHSLIDATKLKGKIREAAANWGDSLGYMTRRVRDWTADSASARKLFTRRKTRAGREALDANELEGGLLQTQASPESTKSETKVDANG
jgi:hypothetical protein